MFDAIVVGAGVIGTAVARSLILRKPNLKVAVLEKESAVARHTSGRNSGVLHAGFNQKPGALKARCCVEGNARARDYALKNKVPMKQVGTLITALNQSEFSVLDELLTRGNANGVPDLKIIDAQEIRKLEPNAQGIAALHAPSGAIVDSRVFVETLASEAKEKGVQFLFDHKVVAIEENTDGFKIVSKNSSLLTTYSSRFLINCAGLYADKVAHMIGVGQNFTIIPFRGEYYKVVPSKSNIINSMVYPVPNLKYPFLGVHWTKKIDGSVAIGPNAVIAFGRESYKTLAIQWKETLAMVRAPFLKMLASSEFREHALRQLRLSLSKKAFIEEARQLVTGVNVEDLLAGSAGNRAQLIDRAGNLVDDLVVEKKNNSIHVLNAVSPGFTSALPFADFVLSQLGV